MSTRFDDWNDVVDCNNCARYWDDSCDAVSEGQKRACNSFLATRSVVIPEQIKALQESNKSLTVTVAVALLWLVVLSVLVGVL